MSAARNANRKQYNVKTMNVCDISVTEHQQQSLNTYETNRFPLAESVFVFKI